MGARPGVGKPEASPSQGSGGPGGDGTVAWVLQGPWVSPGGLVL